MSQTADKTLSHEDVMAFYNNAQSNTILINVLPPDYYNMAHIPHSVNIPIDLEDFIETVKAHSKGFDNVVLYCANEACTASANALQVLQDAGMDNVYDFEGGMQEWHEAGGPLSMNMEEGGCCGGGGCGSDDNSESAGGCCDTNGNDEKSDSCCDTTAQKTSKQKNGGCCGS